MKGRFAALVGCIYRHFISGRVSTRPCAAGFDVSSVHPPARFGHCVKTLKLFYSVLIKKKPELIE